MAASNLSGNRRAPGGGGLSNAGRGSVNDLFGRGPGSGAGGAGAPGPFDKLRISRLDEFDAPLDAQRRDVAGVTRRTGADISNFRTALTGTQPGVNTALQQEQADIGQLFNPGGLESQLGAVRAKRKAALGGLEGTLLSDLRRTLNLNAAGRGGTGLGSYLTRTAANQAARIRTQAIEEDAAQERRDLADVLAARRGAVGQRQQLADAAARRSLLPVEAELSRSQGTQALLARALESALANSDLTFGYGGG